MQVPRRFKSHLLRILEWYYHNMDYHKVSNLSKLPELKKLSDLTTLPKTLYFIGKWDAALFENCIAVVGSRRMTNYGQRVVEKIIPRLIAKKQTIVSGFMYGVDQYAHQVCIEGGGKTIAVLGWGIDQKLTGEDLKLAKKIIDSGGLLLSEWEQQLASHWTFPSRNRIVAALSKEVIIVEAAQNSGSLITARIAAHLKRILWAVPGPITSRTSYGTNKLIAKGLAKMWLGEDAIMVQNNDPILQVLDNEALTADEMARVLHLPVSEVGAQLSMLTLSGQILEKEGKYYVNDAS